MRDSNNLQPDDGQDLRWVSEQEDFWVITIKRVAGVLIVAMTIACGFYFWSGISADETVAEPKDKTEQSLSFLGFDLSGIFGTTKKKTEIPEDEKVWSELKHSTDVNELNNFVLRFPESELVKFANLRLRELAPTPTQYAKETEVAATSEPEEKEEQPAPAVETTAKEPEKVEETKVANVQQNDVVVREEYSQNTDARTAVIEPESKNTQDTNPVPATPSIVNNSRRVRVLQYELKRVGCMPGRTDGRWGYAGKKALNEFNRYANKDFNAEYPTEDVITLLRQTRYRVCPDPRSNSAALKSPEPVKAKPQVRKPSAYQLKQKKAYQKKQQQKAYQRKQLKKRKALKKKKKRSYASCMNEYSGDTARAAVMCQDLN